MYWTHVLDHEHSYVLYCSKPAHHVQALHTNLMIQNCGHGAGPLRGEMYAEINVLSFNTCSEHAVLYREARALI